MLLVLCLLLRKLLLGLLDIINGILGFDDIHHDRRVGRVLEREKKKKCGKEETAEKKRDKGQGMKSSVWGT